MSSRRTGVRTTRFRDVCGSIDELKRALYEEPQLAAAQPAVLESLVDDALFMLDRMDARVAEYDAFRSRIVSLARSLEQLAGSQVEVAATIAPGLKAVLTVGRVLSDGERERAVVQAEAIRDVAQETENTLNRYKALALELERAYREVKGSRAWVLDEAESEAAAQMGGPEWARWLPPSPHRERIVRWLASGRAHLIPTAAGEDGPPQVQFQDGGVMTLPRVRWSDDLRSFYDGDRPPDARARLYRDYAGRRVFPAGIARASPPSQGGDGTAPPVASPR